MVHNLDIGYVYLHFSLTNLNLDIYQILKTLLFPLILAIPLFFVLKLINSFINVNNWLLLILTYGLMCLLAIIYTYFICLNKNEKLYLIDLIKSKTKKKL